MSSIEKVSYKLDLNVEQEIQRLRNEEMKIFKEYQKDTKKIYEEKYKERRQVIVNKINQLQYIKEKKEADQA